MRSLLAGRPELDDPLYSQKNPHQTFLLLFSLLASVPLLRGQSNSDLLDRELDGSAFVAWGSALLFGSLITLLGQFWRGRTWTALVIERLGLGLVCVAAAVYAYVVWDTARANDGVAYLVGIQVGYACACAWRCLQISLRLRFIRKLEADRLALRNEINGAGGPPGQAGT